MHMCGDNECRRKCVLCRKFRCSDVCKFYKPRECEKLNKPPYVCNGCSKKTNCMMDKKIYSSKYAQDSYETLRTTSREGINQTTCCHRFSKKDSPLPTSTHLMLMRSPVPEEPYTLI